MKLIQGDNLIKIKDIPDNKVDLTVTSPPYDNLRTYNNQKVFTFEDFKILAYELYRVTKTGGVVVWVVGDATINGSETGTSFKQALYFKEVGFNLHDTMIYQKTGFANPSSDRYHQTFEYMFVLSKGKPKTFNPIKDRKNKYKKRGGPTRRLKNGEMKEGTGYQELNEYGQRFNIWEISHSDNNRIHPASFPPELSHDHIVSWSNEKDLILDPFMGSGTTGVACKQLNRDFIGIELDEGYFKKAEKRINKAVRQDELFTEQELRL